MILQSKFSTQTLDESLQEFLEKYSIEKTLKNAIKTLRYRIENPDWERPTILYGIRKEHKFIKKKEIGVILDREPWCDRVRTAETHWFKILYKRPATDLEWQEASGNKRYIVWHYFINKRWSIDRIISHIAQDDCEEYGVDPSGMITAFEKYYQRKIRIYRRHTATQLTLFNQNLLN